MTKLELTKKVRGATMTTNPQGGIVLDREHDTMQTGYLSVSEQVDVMMRAGESVAVARDNERKYGEARGTRRYAGSPDPFEDVDNARTYMEQMQQAKTTLEQRQQAKKDKATKTALEKAEAWDREQAQKAAAGATEATP